MRFRCLAIAISCLLVPISEVRAEAPPTRPNILLIMADDLGSNDLELTNPERRTPHINGLAEGGIRFTRHYTDTTCSPTRAGVLTGLAPARLGFRPVQRGISPDVPTLPKVLSQAGYETYHIGKWHVGNATNELSPTQAGFDGWYGFLTQHELGGPSPDGLHFKWPRYRDPWIQTESRKPEETSGHLTDLLTDHAIRTINDLNRRDAPWFINLWFFAPHAPIQPDRRFASKYDDDADGRYRALIEQLDSSVGRVIEHLRKQEKLDDTLILFMSDNGGTGGTSSSNGALPGHKGQQLEGGVRTPLIWHWPAVLSGARTVDVPVSFLDVLPTLVSVVGADSRSHEWEGVDLWPAIKGGEPFPRRELFWESLGPTSRTFSVLDRGGRWRLSRSQGISVLYDVAANGSDARVNRYDEQPEVAKRLERAYVSWHDRQHRPSIRIKTVNELGAARITGDDVQRSPGQGGFTFAIGVTPMSVASAPNKMQHVAGQAGFWHLSFKNGKPLTLHFLGERLEGPVLEDGKCAAIIVRSHYNYSRMSPQNNRGQVELIVDGVRVDHVVRENPRLPPSRIEKATGLGFRPGRTRSSQLRFGEPQFFNEWFGPAGKNGSSGHTLEALSNQLCEGSSDG